MFGKERRWRSIQDYSPPSEKVGCEMLTFVNSFGFVNATHLKKCMNSHHHILYARLKGPEINMADTFLKYAITLLDSTEMEAKLINLLKSRIATPNNKNQSIIKETMAQMQKIQMANIKDCSLSDILFHLESKLHPDPKHSKKEVVSTLRDNFDDILAQEQSSDRQEYIHWLNRVPPSGIRMSSGIVFNRTQLLDALIQEPRWSTFLMIRKNAEGNPLNIELADRIIRTTHEIKYQNLSENRTTEIMNKDDARIYAGKITEALTNANISIPLSAINQHTQFPVEKCQQPMALVTVALAEASMVKYINKLGQPPQPGLMNKLFLHTAILHELYSYNDIKMFLT